MRARHCIACWIVAYWIVTVGTAVASAADFSTAAGYYATGQWRAAVAAFDRFLTLAPNDERRADAEFFRGEALVQLRRYDQAIDQLKRLLSSYPDHRLAVRAKFRMGECNYLAKRWAEAVDHLDEFTRTHPDHALNEYAVPYLALASSELPGQRGNAARTLLEDVTKRYPDGPMTAITFYRLIELDAAASDLESLQLHMLSLKRAVPDCVENPEWHYWQGMWNKLSRRPNRALAAFNRVIDLEPDQDILARTLLQSARVQSAQGDVDGALDRLAAVSSLGSGSSLVQQSYLLRIRLLLGAGRADAAKRVIADFRQKFPDSTYARDVHRLAGEVLLLQDDFSGAIDVLGQLESGSTSSATRPSVKDAAVSSYQLAAAYYESGRLDDALTALNSISTASLPRAMIARIHYARASIYHKRHEVDEALAELMQAVEVDPDAPFADRVRWKRSICLTQDQRWDKAFADFERWEPTADATWFYRQSGHFFAESAYAAERYHQSAAVFALLLSRSHGDTDTAYGLSGMGWCYLRQQDWSTAAELFQRLIQQYRDDSRVPDSLLARAYCLEQTDDLVGATQQYQEFIHRYPQHASRWRADLRAADLLRKRQAHTDAIRVLEAGLEVAQDDVVMDRLHYLKAWLHRELGDEDESEALFRQIHQRDRASPYWADATYRLAKGAYIRGDAEAAEAIIDQLLTPEQSDVVIRIFPYALYLKARLAAQRNDWHGVLKRLDDLQVTFPDSPLANAARVWAIEALYRLGDLDNVRHRLQALRPHWAELKPAWRRIMDLRDAELKAADRQNQLPVSTTSPPSDRSVNGKEPNEG